MSMNGESKTSYELTLGEDKFYYINGLKITGVAWLERSGSTHSAICTENRVALTKAEQAEIGDSQPFMLPETTVDADGHIVDEKKMAQAYLDKMSAKGKPVKLTQNVSGTTTSVIEQIVADAKMRYNKFEYLGRRFLMSVLREAIKTENKEGVEELPFSALKRGLKEERKKKFKDYVEMLEHKFVYTRRGGTCLLVYFIDSDMLEDDKEAMEKSGKCNYFCAKSVPMLDNSFLETRDHKMIPNSEVEKALIDFENRLGKNGEGCDLKYWGGLKMWMMCKKYF